MTGIEVVDLLFRLVVYAVTPRRHKTGHSADQTSNVTTHGSALRDQDTRTTTGLGNTSYMQEVHVYG